MPQAPLFTRGMLATHVAFSHCYPPVIYYLTERSLFKKCPPQGKILKKGPDSFSKPRLYRLFLDHTKRSLIERQMVTTTVISLQTTNNKNCKYIFTQLKQVARKQYRCCSYIYLYIGECQ